MSYLVDPSMKHKTSPLLLLTTPLLPPLVLQVPTPLVKPLLQPPEVILELPEVILEPLEDIPQELLIMVPLEVILEPLTLLEVH